MSGSGFQAKSRPGGNPPRSTYLPCEPVRPCPTPTSPTMVDSILSDSTQSALDSSQASSFIDDMKDVVEKRPQDVGPTEYRLILDLCDKIKRLAPYMADSFILSPVWWKDNKFKLGIQVSCAVELQGQRLHRYAHRCSSTSSCNLSKPRHTYFPSPTLGSRGRP